LAEKPFGKNSALKEKEVNMAAIKNQNFTKTPKQFNLRNHHAANSN
jgi:hypothetical protein